ncbi:MAG: hypothetical protein LBC33_00730 [Mycoplasmataceae bacterium]|nr:hypothetical protein [Mycoplasmataceae bacterium]
MATTSEIPGLDEASIPLKTTQVNFSKNLNQFAKGNGGRKFFCFIVILLNFALLFWLVLFVCGNANTTGFAANKLNFGFFDIDFPLNKFKDFLTLWNDKMDPTTLALKREFTAWFYIISIGAVVTFVLDFIMLIIVFTFKSEKSVLDVKI